MNNLAKTGAVEGPIDKSVSCRGRTLFAIAVLLLAIVTIVLLVLPAHGQGFTIIDPPWRSAEGSTSYMPIMSKGPGEWSLAYSITGAVVTDVACTERVCYVATQDGRIFVNGILWTQLSVRSDRERGLASLVTDGAGRLWVLFVRADNYIVLGEIDTTTTAMRNVVIFPQAAPEHNAGGIVWDGYRLYVGLGDNERGDLIMSNPNYYFGTIWSINPVNQAAARVASGVRNPWTLALWQDKVWFVDPGESTWEEINQVDLTLPPAHFGWPCYEGTRPADWTSGKCPALVKVDPWFEYPHRDSPSAIVGIAQHGDDVWYADYNGEIRRHSDDAIVKSFAPLHVVRMKPIRGGIAVTTTDGQVWFYR